MRRRDVLKAAPFLAMPALAQGQRPLRFVPQSNLSVLDPVWTTAIIVYNHAYMVYDTLYGYDGAGGMRPQMCAGHVVSSDELTWTFTLRDGLGFHDGEPVLAPDCAASVKRWASRDAVGQQLLIAVHDIVALDDKRFAIHLRKPFRQMLFGLGTRQCFMMPERVARIPGTEQLKDPTGSGPFRFLADEWVSGVRAAYARFDGYVPRQEPPAFFAGGKVAHFDRVEWIVQPDPATQAVALQKNEIDWIELPLVDLCPMLKKSPGITIKMQDPAGFIPFMALNHLHPPFDNPAIWPALDQRAFVESVIGDQAELGTAPYGYFSPILNMASQAGMEALTAPRDIARARQMVRDAGYKGEPVLLMAPSDQALLTQMSQVAPDMFQAMGLTVDYQVMDWGSLVSRRTSQKPVSQGGWSAFISVASALTSSSPGSFQPLRGNGVKAWFGWPTDERMEALREAWFDAPDQATQRAVADQVQLRAFDNVPFVPLGRMLQPTAFRSDIVDVQSASFPVFWGARRV